MEIDKTIEKTCINMAQPYFVSVNVTNKVNAKQEPQPEVSITISRHLESAEHIQELLLSDLGLLVMRAKESLLELRKPF